MLLPLAIGAAMAPNVDGNVPSAVVTRVALSVVEVTASNCSDGIPRTGSGFVYHAKGEIVTANHVVAGCRSFSVFFERATGAPTKDAVLSKVLPDADLALLNVADSPDVPFLEAHSGALSADDMFSAVGFGLHQPTLFNLDVGLSAGAAVLRAMLPPELARQIHDNTSIDLDNHIVRLKAFLEPGMSGGPIVDDQGRVAAIVAGGLEEGTVPASWGWPTASLDRLYASSAAPNNSVALSHALFSTTKDLSDRPTKRCGELDFVNIKSVTYRQAWAAADDPSAVSRVAGVSGRPQAEIDQYRFDVWRNEASGATVTVPAGFSLEEDNAYCVVQSPSGQYQEFFAGVTLDGPDIQLNALQDQGIVQFQKSGVYPDWPSVSGLDSILTMLVPTQRADGFKVRRQGTTFISLDTADANYVAETHMARGHWLVNVAARDNAYGPQYRICLMMPARPDCHDILSTGLTEFAKVVLGSELSTFPVY